MLDIPATLVRTDGDENARPQGSEDGNTFQHKGRGASEGGRRRATAHSGRVTCSALVRDLRRRDVARGPGRRGRGTYVKIKSLGGVNMVKLNKVQTLRGSFSAVSTPNFASKYSLESS